MGLTTLAGVLTAACGLTGLNQMKLPDGVAPTDLLSVEGYSQGRRSTVEKGLSLGPYRVTNINRSKETTGRGSGILWHKLKNTTSFEFAVLAAGRTLQAHCEASLDTLQNSSGARPLQGLACECSEGASTLVKLSLESSQYEPHLQGTASVGATVFSFAPVTARKQGPDSPNALGFAVKSTKGVGALEISGQGRAFLPANLSEEERLGLVCSYGAVLLYQPLNG